MPVLSYLQIGQQADIFISFSRLTKTQVLKSRMCHSYFSTPNCDLNELLTIFDSQLVATRQKSSCSLATSNGESRDSGSTFSLLRAAEERLGLEAWRRVEEMQLGTYSRTGEVQLSH